MHMGFSSFSYPSDYYSRQLDMRVYREEMPYGYEISPPPADTGNFDQRAKESHVDYKPKRAK